MMFDLDTERATCDATRFVERENGRYFLFPFVKYASVVVTNCSKFYTPGQKNHIVLVRDEKVVCPVPYVLLGHTPLVYG